MKTKGSAATASAQTPRSLCLRGERALRDRILCPALLLCLLSISSLAQSGRKVTPPPGVQNKSDIRIETREVHLPLRAWDPMGKDVGDLKPEELLVVEDGEERAVTWLRHEPASVVLVLDLNNEIGTFKNGPSRWYDPPSEKYENPYKRPKVDVIPNPVARDLADNFVAKLAPADQLAIIQYSDKVQLIQDWTLDRQEAINSLKSKFRIGIKASFHDALVLAAEKLKTRESGRRIIVLVSDGTDSNSKKRRQEAFDAVTRAQATVFVISWTALLRNQITNMLHWTGAHEQQNSATYKRGNELVKHIKELGLTETYLTELAEMSGGEILLPEYFDDFLKTPDRVINDIGAQYTMAYLTERGPGLENRRYVEVYSRRPGLTLRTRRRYEFGDEPQNLPASRRQFLAAK
ncbi:MAG TPA: VWA domain-containing protein [Blastocatellia bacterium]|nr:VWA domain-containing protein [Blastocatellia bacterium]